MARKKRQKNGKKIFVCSRKYRKFDLPSLKICRRSVCCMKANWSAALRMLEVTTTSMLVPPLEPPGDVGEEGGKAC